MNELVLLVLLKRTKTKCLNLFLPCVLLLWLNSYCNTTTTTTTTAFITATHSTKMDPYNNKQQPLRMLEQNNQQQQQQQQELYEFEQKTFHVPLQDNITMQIDACFPITIPTTTTTTKGTTTSTKSKNKINKPILFFLHGSFHGSWCWMEYYGPYYAQRGYIVLALNWRGTHGTTTPVVHGDNQRMIKKVKIEQHVNDLQQLLHEHSTMIPSLIQNYTNNDNNNQEQEPYPIIVIAHSFGGIVLMKYLEKRYEDYCLQQQQQQQQTVVTHLEQQQQQQQQYLRLVGLVTMCSVPPSGNGRLTRRFLSRSLYQSYLITIGLALKRCCTNIELCRTLFFDTSVTDDTIQTYQVNHFQKDSIVTIDLLNLAKQLPSYKVQQETGVAYFALHNRNNKDHNNKQQQQQQQEEDDTTTTGFQLPPCLVMGAKYDYIIDYEALVETAQYFGLNPITTSSLRNNNKKEKEQTTPTTSKKDDNPIIRLIDSPHDVMLGSKWINGATMLEEWIIEQTIFLK